MLVDEVNVRIPIEVRMHVMDIARSWGHHWTNPALLFEAMTHSSYGNRHGVPHNERLEFLGDSVLDLLTAQCMFQRYPDKREGYMSNRRVAVVSATPLAELASRMKIGEALIVDERNHGLRSNQNVLADAMEALVGAIYVDLGYDVWETYSVVQRWDMLKAL